MTWLKGKDERVSDETEFSDDITALYRLYDSENALLYVGITVSLRNRMVQHALCQPWWAQVARKTVAWYPDRQDAAAAELTAIKDECPRHNKVVRSNPTIGSTGSFQDDLDVLRRYRAGEFIQTGPNSWGRIYTAQHPFPSDCDPSLAVPAHDRFAYLTEDDPGHAS
jgi:predicted GIY-YIG superfamily endonuclease